MTWVFEHSPYALGTRLVHLAIADVANEDHDWLVWVSQSKIAEKAHVSRPTVTAAIRTMVADGYLEAVTQGVGSPGTYRFLRPCKESDTPLQSTTGEGAKSAEIAPLLLTEVNPNTVQDPFDQFYATYPRHVGRQEARQAFAVARKRATLDQLLAGAERYRDDPNRLDEFTKHPATWLRGGCWEDDPLPPRNGLVAVASRRPPMVDDRGFLRSTGVPEA